MDQSHPSFQLNHDGVNNTPQDVLAEARKNLQMLIDSGVSKDLLHQWVDESQALQLSNPAQQSPVSSNPSSVSTNTPSSTNNSTATTTTTPLSNSPSHSPSLQAQNHHHQQQIPPQPTSLPPPPPPQCPPPPPPHIAGLQMAQQPNVLPSSITSGDIKTESFDGDGSTFLVPHNPNFAHRPRISVSSTSSGSSGHASIWSTNSAQSAMSWQSVGSNCPRMQAPLPLPPTLNGINTSPVTGMPTNAMPTSNPASAASASKHNIYWCTSCETSFKRKYDWKRHEDEFHERWRKYPCPEPGCNRSFWGSNSFNQHHKQCHGCKTCPHADKVVKFLRKRKYWACGFCSALHPSRERHVEHVARHFESGLTKAAWMHSRVVYGLMHQPLIHEAWTNLLNTKQVEHAGRRPRFSWHPSRTGRAQGFLEQENTGQLQDMLEFFSGNEQEAQWIVNAAYDMADIVFDSDRPSIPDSASSVSIQSSPSRDMGVSFNQMTAQSAMMTTSDPNASGHFSQAFGNPIFVPSQSFPQNAAQPSPDSTSHSPLTSNNHSPINPATSQMPCNGIKQEGHLPAMPLPNDADHNMMDIDYSSAASIVFDDWESMHSGMMDEQMHQQNTSGSQQAWGMMPYFGEPRVTS
ncbi:hypothetical protein N3K66_001011 [Trichothecium roseum]|uniref:Uncharacterized protein n=1 Tax=Trichothecium roseum TaxID=47278 RepID=A0ACC0VDF9_9HYPO|nr:hypothetical protein N3K66_001011 [Trichothecium roseum]